MKNYKFLKKEAIKFGWGKMLEHFGFFIFANLIMISAYLLVVIWINHHLRYQFGFGVFLSIYLFFCALYFLVNTSLIKATLKINNNEPVKPADLLSAWPFLIKMFLSSIVYAVLVLVGFILLIVPGFLLAVRMQYYYFEILEGKGIIASLKNSWQITKGSFWNIFLLDLLLVVINLGGLASFIIGLVFTSPTVLMAQAHVYKKLTSHKEEVPIPN